MRDKIILGRRKIKGKDPEAGTSLIHPRIRNSMNVPWEMVYKKVGGGAQCVRPMEGTRNS